jgi:hypothetical protein
MDTVDVIIACTHVVLLILILGIMTRQVRLG